MTKNLPAFVRARLLNIARDTDVPSQELHTVSDAVFKAASVVVTLVMSITSQIRWMEEQPMARDEQDNHDERKTFNMWTKPASGESPSLEALENLQGDEEVSLTREDREQIDRRSETFQDRFPSVSNGDETYFP